MAFGEYFAVFIMRLLAHIDSIVKANNTKMILLSIALILCTNTFSEGKGCHLIWDSWPCFGI